MTEQLGGSQKEKKKQRTIQEFISEQQRERRWVPQAMDSDGKQERDMPKKTSDANSPQTTIAQQPQQQYNEQDHQASDPQRGSRQHSEAQ